MSCPSCGAAIPAGSNFCPNCGEPVMEDGTMAATFGQLALDQQTRDLLETDLEGEQRLVTVLFADMTQSVRRTVDLSPEEAMLLVNDLLEAMAEILVRYGGRIDRFLGDGVLAVFGTPVIKEDDPERAVRAALDIQEQADELDLGVTVGINTGQVYFGPVGSTAHQEITVMGSTVNLAARLQGRASQGQILIGEATREHVHRAFALTPVSLTIKGIDEEVIAYEAGRILDDPEKVRGIEGLRSQLIGRDRELDLLEHTVREGTVSLVGVSGEAGLGKSRLAAELRSRLDGFRWLEGRCYELARETGYGPIKDMLDREGGDLDQAIEHLVSAGHIDESQAAGIAPFLIDLTDGQLSGERLEMVRSPTAQQRHSLTIAAVLDYLAALAAERKTVLFVDDLHWADDLTVELLETALGEVAHPDLSIVGTYRPDPTAPSAELVKTAASEYSDRFAEVGLHELPQDDTRAMVASLMTIDGLPPRLEELIVTMSDGNPFYVEELIRSFIQRGILYRDGVTWRATDHIAFTEVPESVQAVVMSRIDRLDRPTRRAAQIASVVGRTVSRKLFEGVAPQLSIQMESLSEAGVLVPEAEEGEYRFVHALAHDAIYRSLLSSRTAQVHEVVGGVLEVQDPDRVDDLAHHYERSRNHHKAVQYLYEAGKEAANAYLGDAALALFERGLDRVSELASEEREEWTARYRAERGALLEILGRHADARADLEAALTATADPRAQANLLRLIGQTLRLEDETDRALESYSAGEKALASSPDFETTEYQRAYLDIQREKAFALYFGGRGDELGEHNAGMEPVVLAHGAIEHQADFITTQLLDGFRAVRWAVPAKMVIEARRGLELSERTANPARIADARFVLGFALLWSDQLDEAEPTLRRAVDESDRVGDAVLHLRATAFLAIAVRRLGLVEETTRAAQQALTVAESLDDPFYPGHALANLCWAAWSEGKRDEALALGDRAIESWGFEVRDGERYLGSNFAWLVVWPLIAMAGPDRDRVVSLLSYLFSPWERPMPEDLTAAVRNVIDGDGSVDVALRLAEEYRLL